MVESPAGPRSITVSQDYWLLLLRELLRLQTAYARELFWVEYLRDHDSWRGYW